MNKLSKIWTELRKKDRTKDYVRFQVCQNIELGIQSNYTELNRDNLRRLCLTKTTPSTIVSITEPKMKVFSIETINQLINIWKHNVNKKIPLTYGWEGPAYRFIGLVRGDYYFASIAMGIAWVDRVRGFAYPSSVDMSGMTQQTDIYELEGLHVLNFFVCQKGKIIWFEPQEKTEVMEELTKYRPKLMIL